MKQLTKRISILMSLLLVWGMIFSTPIVVFADVLPNDALKVSGNSADNLPIVDQKLNYIYLESDCIVGSQEQNILVSYGDDQTVIESAILTCLHVESGSVYKYSMTNHIDNASLFTVTSALAAEGTVKITDVFIRTKSGMEESIHLADIGMDGISFCVGASVSTEGSDNQIITLNADGSRISGSDIQILNRSLQMSSYECRGNSIKTEASQVVIFLDPGHDATHIGANKNGLAEETLNLKIAQYCKEELESYYGVKVYMSRSGAGCPYPGTSSATDNVSRVQAAASVGANAYISIHLNSAANSGINGAEVFYPNANYNAGVGSSGANIATQVERQLAALGLKNRGISIRNSGDGTRYPDGSLADYYSVIRNSKLSGMPAIIIEHAYVTGSSDANYLKSESNLRALGIADATGIANAFQLSRSASGKANRARVEAFVTRLYRLCLSREPDASGLKYWTDGICAYRLDGTETAHNFIFSQEMVSRNLSNEEYVETLYNTFLDRASDPDGKAYWVDKLANGASRNGIFMGFANSREFSGICDSYGIEKGTAKEVEARDYNLGLTAFISRLYTKALGRQYDVDGLNFWCKAVYSGNSTIYKVATQGFFHSKEFRDKNLSDEEYVKVLYRTFLDREYDQAGLEYWLNRLATGSSRDTILNEFANSKEFAGIKKSYGLKAQ